MPFKSKAQWRACFAKNDPNWDCGEWADSTPSYKELPKKKKEKKAASAAWQRSEGKNSKGGLNEKGRKSYERENPGSDLKAPVTGKVKPGGKAAKRRKSFCARMKGNKGPMKKPNGEPTRKALSLRKWKCSADALYFAEKSKKYKTGTQSTEKQSSASTLVQTPLGQVMADIITNSFKTRGLAKESNMMGKVEQKAQQQAAAQQPSSAGVPGSDPNEIAKQLMALRNPGADGAAPASALPGQGMGMLRGYNQPGPLGANLANSQLGSLPGGVTGAGRSVGESGPMKMAAVQGLFAGVTL